MPYGEVRSYLDGIMAKNAARVSLAEDRGILPPDEERIPGQDYPEAVFDANLTEAQRAFQGLEQGDTGPAKQLLDGLIGMKRAAALAAERSGDTEGSSTQNQELEELLALRESLGE